MNGNADSEVYWWRPLEGDDAEPDTRQKILFAAYKEIHMHGFQAASLKNILAHTGVTKGALYHHFPNKTELGYAVIEEVIAQRIHLSFIHPLQFFENPVDGFIELILGAGSAFSMRDIELGCPLTTLSQEMAPIDEGFRVRLSTIYEQWNKSVVEVFRQAKQDNLIIDIVEPEQIATMMVATLEGCLNAAKVSQNLGKLMQCGEGLVLYLNLIRK